MKKLLLSVVIVLLSVVSFSRNSSMLVSKPTFPDSLIHFFQRLDPLILQSGNEKQIAQYLSEHNNDMFKYMADRYPKFGPYDMIDMHDETATWIALIYALYESVNFGTLETGKDNFQGRTPQWVICILDIIGAATGINEIITQLTNLSAGSLWSAIKTIVKKHLRGWITVAFALVRILDDCI